MHTADDVNKLHRDTHKQVFPFFWMLQPTSDALRGWLAHKCSEQAVSGMSVAMPGYFRAYIAAVLLIVGDDVTHLALLNERASCRLSVKHATMMSRAGLADRAVDAAMCVLDDMPVFQFEAHTVAESVAAVLCEISS